MSNSTLCSRHWLFLLVLIAGLAGGCKTSRTAVLTTRNATAASVMQLLVSNQVNASWLDAKAKITFNGDDQKISVAATIRMRKDSLIWASIKKLGFEIARVKITRDSVYVLDRINSQYMVHDMKYLEDQVSAPASLNSLQALILGNPVFFSTSNMQLETNTPFYHLYSEKEALENHYWITLEDHMLKKMDINDGRARRNMSMELNEYAKVPEHQNFSYLRTIEMDSQETGKVEVELKFSDVVLNTPVDLRFDIPERYTRVQ